jgi:hypothetical protein
MMFGTMGMHDIVVQVFGAVALWLLFRLYQLMKSIHFMLQKWFERDFLGGQG